MTDDTYRILAPSEYRALLTAIPKLDYRMMVETMLNTGMRYQELRTFGKHPEWFDAKNRVIKVPAEVNCSKANRFRKAITGRNVYLVPQFSEKLEMYLAKSTLKFPRKESMNLNLKRWWYFCSVNTDPHMFCGWYVLCKTFRKTWESYLLSVDYPLIKVAKSQGHAVSVCERHYANLDPVLITEKEAVKELTRGWMT